MGHTHPFAGPVRACAIGDKLVQEELVDTGTRKSCRAFETSDGRITIDRLPRASPYLLFPYVQISSELDSVVVMVTCRRYDLAIHVLQPLPALRDTGRQGHEVCSCKFVEGPEQSKFLLVADHITRVAK